MLCTREHTYTCKHVQTTNSLLLCDTSQARPPASALHSSACHIELARARAFCCFVKGRFERKAVCTLRTHHNRTHSTKSRRPVQEAARPSKENLGGHRNAASLMSQLQSDQAADAAPPVVICAESSFVVEVRRASPAPACAQD